MLCWKSQSYEIVEMTFELRSSNSIAHTLLTTKWNGHKEEGLRMKTDENTRIKIEGVEIQCLVKREMGKHAKGRLF